MNNHNQAHLRRYRQIAEVLLRHGLNTLIPLLGLERFVPFRRERLLPPRRGAAGVQPRHLRLALEELGATFIKLGQILSTRPDLLPPEYQAELARLQDAAPALPPGVAEEVLAAELGRPVSACFAAFEPVPFAAASIGQVHAATLRDGTPVVVKIRRPGVVEQIEVDLEILLNLATVAARHWELADRYDAVGLVQEFAQTLRAELDYIREGRSAERFAANFAADPTIHVPRVFWETTTARVLTLERITGIKINDTAALDAARIDRAGVARRAARIVCKMVFEDGFFHADPHPGNFFIEPDGRIGLIDFGMVGTVDTHTQEHLVEALLAVTSQDADRMVDAFLELGVAQRQIDRALLRRDLEHLVSRYYGLRLEEIAIGALLADALTVVRRHQLQLPAHLALLIKTVVMHEGLGVQLDPGFNLAALLLPYARRLVLRQYSPLFWTGQAAQAGRDAVRLGVELPHRLRRLIGELERGGLEVGMRPTGLEPLLRRAERIVNRIILGILTAAFINGLAVLLSVYHPPGWEQWAGVFFAVGFVLAGALGGYLAWAILRAGRH
jgi:ubiquinone biosynthesis protein